MPLCGPFKRLLNVRSIMVCSVALAVAPIASALGIPPDDYDRWFTISLDGQRAGWMHLNQSSEGDEITTTSQMQFSIRRGDNLVSIGYETTFIESATGEPIRAHKRDELSASPVTVQYTFNPDGVEVKATSNGRSTTETKPTPTGVWLSPAATTEFVARRLASGAKQISVRTMDPGVGLSPVGIKRSVEGRQSLEVLGKEVSVYRCSSVYSSQPEVTVAEFLDDSGLLVRYETSLGEIRIEAMVATQAQALAHFRAPELMRSTFVRPDRAISNPRRTREASFVLRVPDGDIALPTFGAQRVEAVSEQAVRVTINLNRESVAMVDDIASLIASSRLLDTSDPVVREMAERATRGTNENPRERAEAMRQAVGQHIAEKAMDIGFASASEVARVGRGDCTEHAVLLAALLRVDEIPSRVVSGLIYTPEFAGERDVFAFHMWTQALIETDAGHVWVDLDATMPRSVAFDATHIAIAPADLADGRTGDALRPVAELLGRLSVEVESTK